MNYSFYGRLKQDFPSQVLIDITENCNYACSHCPHANFTKSPVYTGANLSPELNKKVIDEVNQYGKGSTQHIRYSADGEPLLHPKVYEMLTYACLNFKGIVSLTTNGSMLNKNNIDRLLNMGIGMIDVSLDAYSSETYSKIRINGIYENVKNNVLYLLNARKEGNFSTRIVVSFVKQPLNYHETESFKLFWEQNGVDYVIIRNLHTAGGALASQALGIDIKQRKPCVYPWERISLTANGHLSYCPASWLGKTTICDYEKNSIHEVWNGEFYKKLREAHSNGELSEFDGCKQCEDWKVINWPEEGRGYGDLINDFQEMDKRQD